MAKKFSLSDVSPERRKEIARLGGLVHAKNKAHMAACGRKGGAAVYEKYGSEHYRRLGSKGGKALYDKRGAAHFSQIGAKGMANRGKPIDLDDYEE